MAMDAYTGLPGSGKSYGVLVNVIMPALQRGQRVVTNIPLNADKLEALGISTAKLTQLERAPAAREFMEAPAGAMLVIDEAWHWWPSGLKADAMPAAQRSFFAEHRHRSGEGFSTGIVLVVQDLSMICAFVRALVDKTYRAVKLDAVGADNRFRVDVYQGGVTGQNPPVKQRLASEHGTYEPKYYECYTSQTQSQGGTFGSQKRADKRATIWSSWTMRAAIAAVVAVPFAVAGVGCALTNFKESVTKSPPKPQPARPLHSPPPVEAPPPTLQAQPPAPPAKPAEPEPSKLWRVIGVAVRKDGTGRALLATTNARRWISLETCRRRGIDADMVCEVDGELVGYYTGLGGAFATAASVSGTVR